MTGGRALNCWRVGNAMALRGIPTARPTAVAVRRRWGFVCNSGYVADRIQGDNLGVLLRGKISKRRDASARRLRRSIAREAGAVLGLFHARGFRHRDLKASNFMVKTPDGDVALFMIDLDGARHRRAGRDRRVRDLARFARSVRDAGGMHATEALVFLRTYVRALGGGKESVRRLWRDVWAQLPLE